MTFIFSPETQQKLEHFKNLLLDWNRAIPLVSTGDVDKLWERHILDSAQLTSYITSKNRAILDIGSGGGFPGIVLAILGYRLILVDSHLKKTLFLKEVARQLNLDCDIVCARVETLSLTTSPLFVSRATMSLPDLLKIMEIVSRETSFEGFFHKGREIEKEIKEAQQKTQFSYELYPSIVEPDGYIVRVQK